VEQPKLVKSDVQIFLNLLKDIFPQSQDVFRKRVGEQERESEFSEELSLVCSRNGLFSSEFLSEKCQQIFETVQVRHGMIVIGKAGVGKSTALSVTRQTIASLAEEIIEDEGGGGGLYRKVNLFKINPKSVPSNVLYGGYEQDPETGTVTWVDGILALCLRSYLENNLDKKDEADYCWLILDGPVDSIWIENMNTLLDDNKKLCLNNGEVIKLTPYISTIFECDSLKFASPATVSRCGIVYLEPPTQTSWEVYIEGFFINEQVKEIFFDQANKVK
jgi:dynein heavy chain, axonemal